MILMGDPSFSRQNTFEAARDDTFFKLTTLTRLVKGQPANEDALVELTGSANFNTALFYFAG